MEPQTERHPTRFKQFRNNLHTIFKVEQLPEQTQERYDVTQSLEWTAEHAELLDEFAKAVYNSDPYENYSYVEIYEHYTTTLETETVPETLDDPALREFAYTLLEKQALADDFLSRYSSAPIFQNHENDAIEAPEQ